MHDRRHTFHVHPAIIRQRAKCRASVFRAFLSVIRTHYRGRWDCRIGGRSLAAAAAGRDFYRSARSDDGGAGAGVCVCGSHAIVVVVNKHNA